MYDIIFIKFNQDICYLLEIFLCFELFKGYLISTLYELTKVLFFAQLKCQVKCILSFFETKEFYKIFVLDFLQNCKFSIQHQYDPTVQTLWVINRFDGTNLGLSRIGVSLETCWIVLSSVDFSLHTFAYLIIIVKSYTADSLNGHLYIKLNNYKNFNY